MECATLSKEEFPEKLLQIAKPPEKLWLRGVLPPEGTKMLAVVGSRALSRYGREACENLIAGLAGYPISIVSGLALGADACAHKAALASGLHTIAIPGSGLSNSSIGPRTNFSLAMKILESGGALLSEHEPEYIAQPFDFPSRNRIMVGLSDAVLIVEASNKSGTLITARLAADYNRDLLCIPHRIGDPHGYGAHLFIRLGAQLVSEPSHVLEALGIEQRQSTKEEGEQKAEQLPAEERTLFDALSEPLSRDELLRASELPVSTALQVLGSLELKGMLKEEFGLWRRA